MLGFDCRRSPALIALACWVWPAVPALGNVDLEWRQEPGAVQVGDTVRIGLYAVSDSGSNQLMAGMDVIISWDPVYLQLLGIDNNGPYSWFNSYFPPNDPFGLNEVVPPQDGEGLYLAQGGFVTLPEATPQGLLVTTFEFQAMAGTCGAVVSILDAAGSPPGYSIVWSGITPGTAITGRRGAVSVAIASQPCGDMNCDGVVDGRDAGPFTLALLDPAAYAAAYPGCSIAAGDVNGDGSVDVGDIQDFVAALLN